MGFLVFLYQVSFDCHLAGRHIPQLISGRLPEKTRGGKKNMLTQIFTLSYCEATRLVQLLSACLFSTGITHV